MAEKVHSKNDRATRHRRIRARVSGTADRPRLAVFRSNKYLSAQLIDDVTGTTLAQAHGKEFGGKLMDQAAKVGEAIAARGKEKGITTAVFDRGGYQYTGRIAVLADAARNAGLTI